MVEATGQVDYINTSIGVATATLYMIEASMQIPPGYALFIPSAIRAAVDLPVVGVGRFKDPLQADRALADGVCDLVGVVRGQIADPDFAAKARSGHATDIRTCLSCNQECVGRMGLNRWLGCIENPRTGREAESRAPTPSAAQGRGGRRRAGRAAGRGHRGRARPPRRPLRAPRPLGGQAQVAASVPSRAEFFDIARNLIVAARREGVDLRTGVEATADTVRAESPDAVIVATGARPAASVVGRRRAPGGRRARRPGGPGPSRGPGGGRRRARLPPGDLHRRAVGRPGLPGRDRDQRAWWWPRTSGSPSTWRRGT